MMLASSMGTPKLGAASRVVYPGSANTACLSRSLLACQTRTCRVRVPPQACPTLNAQSSSTRRRTPNWLPCVRQSGRRRQGVTQASQLPAAPAADESPVVARLGPLSLTIQECSRFLVPALVVHFLTRVLDGKGLLLLAQGGSVAAAMVAIYRFISRTCQHLWDITWSDETDKRWCFPGIICNAAWIICAGLLVCWALRRCMVPITVRYPVYSGVLPVLAPVALFIKQNPAVAAGCYSLAKALPPVLYLSALVNVVRRAAQHAPAGVNSTAASSAAAAVVAGNDGAAAGAAAEGTAVAATIAALQAEKEQLRSKVDDLAKRLSAVEDSSGNDQAQNVLLRRMGEVESQFGELSAKLAGDLSLLRESLFRPLADGAAESRIREFEDAIAARRDIEQHLAASLAAAESRLADVEKSQTATELWQSLQPRLEVDSMHVRLAAAEAMLVKLQDSSKSSKTTINGRLERMEEKFSRLEREVWSDSCLLDTLFVDLEDGTRMSKIVQMKQDIQQAEERVRDLSSSLAAADKRLAALEQASGSGGPAAEVVDSLQARLAAAEALLEKLQFGVYGNLIEESYERDTLPFRMNQAEEKIMAFQTAIVGSGHDNGEELFSAYQAGGLIKGLAAMEEAVAQLQAQLAEAVQAAAAAEKDVRARLTEDKEQIGELKFGLEAFGEDGEAVYSWVERFEEDIKQLKSGPSETAKAEAAKVQAALQQELAAAQVAISSLQEDLAAISKDSLKWSRVQARMQETEAGIARLRERLGVDSEEDDPDAEDVLSLLYETEDRVFKLEQKSREQAEAIALVENQVESAVAVASAAEEATNNVREEFGFLETTVTDMRADTTNLNEEAIRLDELAARLYKTAADAEAAVASLQPGGEAVSALEEAFEGELAQVEEQLSALKLSLEGMPNSAALQEVRAANRSTLELLGSCKEAADGASGQLAGLCARVDAVSAKLEELLGRSEAAEAAAAPPSQPGKPGLAEAGHKRAAAPAERLQLVKPLVKQPSWDPCYMESSAQGPTFSDHQGVSREKMQALKRTLDTNSSCIPNGSAGPQRLLDSSSPRLSAGRAIKLADLEGAAAAYGAAAAQLPVAEPEAAAQLGSEEAAGGDAPSGDAEVAVDLALMSAMEEAAEEAAAASEDVLPIQWLDEAVDGAVVEAFQPIEDEDDVVDEQLLSEGGEDEEESAAEDAAVEAAFDAGFVVMEDLLLSADHVDKIDRFFAKPAAVAKELLGLATEAAVEGKHHTDEKAQGCDSDESADSFDVPVVLDSTVDEEGITADEGEFSEDDVAASFEEAAREVQMGLGLEAADLDVAVDVSDDEDDDDGNSDDEDADISDGESFDLDVETE